MNITKFSIAVATISAALLGATLAPADAATQPSSTLTSQWIAQIAHQRAIHGLPRLTYLRCLSRELATGRAQGVVINQQAANPTQAIHGVMVRPSFAPLDGVNTWRVAVLKPRSAWFGVEVSGPTRVPAFRAVIVSGPRPC